LEPGLLGLEARLRAPMGHVERLPGWRLAGLFLFLLQQLAGVGQGLLRADPARRSLLRNFLPGHFLRGGLLRVLLRRDLLRRDLLLRSLLCRHLLPGGALLRDLFCRLPCRLLRCAVTRGHADAGHVASLARYYRRWATGITPDIHAG